jgi:hypothetical protein
LFDQGVPVSGRRIAILVLPTTNWPYLQARAREIAVAVDGLKPGQYVELTP